jgi:hypothetical protein
MRAPFEATTPMKMLGPAWDFQQRDFRKDRIGRKRTIAETSVF